MPSSLAWKVSQKLLNDMVIAGKDEMEHDRNFLAFVEKFRNNNLTLNAEKIQFKQSQVSFYGHCWSKKGIALDPKKIEALNHMEFPPAKGTMRSFLGMVNLLQLVQCTQCTSLCIPQCTHASGCRLQTKKGAF